MIIILYIFLSSSYKWQVHDIIAIFITSGILIKSNNMGNIWNGICVQIVFLYIILYIIRWADNISFKYRKNCTYYQ